MSIWLDAGLSIFQFCASLTQHLQVRDGVGREVFWRRQYHGNDAQAIIHIIVLQRAIIRLYRGISRRALHLTRSHRCSFYARVPDVHWSTTDLQVRPPSILFRIRI
jgi:hypothetical protein